MEPLSDAEKQRIMMASFDAMKFYTLQNLTAVYSVHGDGFGALLGSGTFINLKGQPYILTAGHVFRDGEPFPCLAHSTSYGAKPKPITNWQHESELPEDAGLVRLDQDALSGTAKAALGSGNLAANSEGVEDDLLFLQGFPGAKSKPIKMLDGVFSESHPYGAATGESKKYPWFDPKMHIALDYSAKGMINPDGSAADPVEPYGLSGSALWKLNIAGTSAKKWSPDKAKIVGVVTVWDDKYDCLIATRIEFIRKFILSALRHEHAYFRWLGRGRPQGGELDDWLDAERSVIAID